MASRRKPKRKRYEVVPLGKKSRQYADGWRWAVMSAGGHGFFEKTKEEAVRGGAEVARENEPSQLVIHDRHGVFQSERTYGSDPFPPRG